MSAKAKAGTLGAIGEDALIELFARDGGPTSPKLLVPNGDDAAVYFLEPPYASVVTTDTLVEGVHFDLSYATPRSVGRKLLAVNLSDIAAMGGRPRYVLLSVCFPPSTKVEVAAEIAEGVREHCRTHRAAIIGGNCTQIHGPIVLTATLIGRVEPDLVMRRRGTWVGDALFVTGALGQARAGLLLEHKPVPSTDPAYPLYSALVDPVPRVEAGRALAKARLVHAMCDVSDGLGRDIHRLLGPEGLGARLHAQQLPISPALAQFAVERGLSPEELALQGGEDYELLFTADPNDAPEVERVLGQMGTPVAQIGTVTAAPEVEVILSDGTVAALPSGYEHFRAAEGQA